MSRPPSTRAVAAHKNWSGLGRLFGVLFVLLCWSALLPAVAPAHAAVATNLAAISQPAGRAALIPSWPRLTEHEADLPVVASVDQRGSVDPDGHLTSAPVSYGSHHESLHWLVTRPTHPFALRRTFDARGPPHRA